jgi:hypothetical protein
MTAGAEWVAKRYRVTFERIGRDHNPAPIELEARNGDELTTLIYRHVKGKLASREIEVSVFGDGKKGLTDGSIIVGGAHSAGTFTVEALK